MSEVEIRLLGGFGARVDGGPVPERAWRLKKARELVKLLALAPGHRLHREQAMDVLWQDRDPAAAANNLHQAVHVARRALGAQSIEVRDESLRLTADVDVDQLERAAADARRSGSALAYRAALARYGGELLPENRYDDWVEDRRAELSRLQAELADELAALGPVDERHRLPAAASSFVGRTRELNDLRALLAKTRLLTLVGTGGAGKTRLALELARGAEAGFEHGAAFVELAPVTAQRMVVDAAAAVHDVRALPGRTLLDALVDLLARRRLLLVLDNCEHVLGAASALAGALLRGATGVTVLATSREPLHIPGETVFRVPSLAIPDPDLRLQVDELLRYEAVRLFAERAAAAAPGFALDGDNAADVARICLRLDGLPLALELAAGRLGALGTRAIAERLDDRFTLLRAGTGGAPTRQQTLAATLQWSHDLLEPDERVLLRRLAAFAGGFELPAVEAVCADGDLDARAIADMLARLVEKSLVTPGDGTRERRYRLLETVRLYACERLTEAGEARALARRHARWALALAERDRELPALDREAANLRAALDTLLDDDPQGALQLSLALMPFWLRRIDLADARRYYAAALERAPARTALRADALLAAAAIDYRGGTLATGAERTNESLGIAIELGDLRAEWRALQMLGGFGITKDQGAEAIGWLDRGLALARRHGFQAEEASCIYSLGAARWILGDLDGADDLLARSIERFRALADSSQERIPSPINISEMRTADRPDRPAVRFVFEETLQPFVEVSCEAALGYALANRAGLARLRGDLALARALLDEAAALFARTGDERGAVDVLARRAFLALAEGSLGAARADLQCALTLRRPMNDRRGVGLLLTGLGLLELEAGDHERAERHVAEACDIFRRAGDPWGLAATLWRAADIAFARGRPADAEAALLEARAVLEESRRDRWIAHTLVALAEAALLRRDLEGATARFAEAREHYAVTHYRAGVAYVDGRAKTALRPRKGRDRRTASTVKANERSP